MYKVIREKGFKDLKDNYHFYNFNDNYPREGLKPTKERIKELSSIENKIGEILIISDSVLKKLAKSLDKEYSSTISTEDLIYLMEESKKITVLDINENQDNKVIE